MWALIGLFCALLINRAADCWLNPARLQCGLTKHPWRDKLVLIGLPFLFIFFANVGLDPRRLWLVSLTSAVLILLMVLDLEQLRIPDVVVYPTIGVTLVVQWQNGQIVGSLAGMALALAIFGMLFALGRRVYGPGALGMGDVKLAALLGAILGLRLVPFALFLGVILAGLAAAILLVTGRIGRRATFPYGVFLAMSGLIMLIGNGIWLVRALSF